MDEPKRRSPKPKELKHKVEYTMAVPDLGTTKVTQAMTQAAIAEMLVKPGITLISINREPAVFYGRKKRR